MSGETLKRANGTRKEWVRDACELIYGDERIWSETLMTYVDDWRDTVVGPINFGSISFSPQRFHREPDLERSIHRRFDRCCHR